MFIQLGTANYQQMSHFKMHHIHYPLRVHVIPCWLTFQCFVKPPECIYKSLVVTERGVQGLRVRLITNTTC